MPPNTPSSSPEVTTLSSQYDLVGLLDGQMEGMKPLSEATDLKVKSFQLGDNWLLSIVYLGVNNPIKAVVVEQHEEFEPDPPGLSIPNYMREKDDRTPMYWWTIHQSFYFPDEGRSHKFTYQEPETMIAGFHGALERLAGGDDFYAETVTSDIKEALHHAFTDDYDDAELRKHLDEFGIIKRSTQ